jgi:putative PIN family toxin of toxin-antitoxin system
VRIVVDSNILVRAFVNRGGVANDLLVMILETGHALVLSNEIIREVSRVLRSTRISRVHGQSEESVYEFALWLKHVAAVVQLNPLAYGPIRDYQDVFVLQTAFSAGADVLCTCDLDFFSPPASAFLESCGIAVMTDVQLIQRLRQ